MEINNFTKLIWKSGKSDADGMLTRAAVAFNQVEKLTVLAGQRRAYTDHIDMENMETKLEELYADNLVFTPLRRSAFYQGFSHRHKEVQPGQPSYWFGVVTTTIKDGKDFKEAENAGDHPAMGSLLGYPECCCNYFVNNFHENYDPVWLGASDVEGVNPGSNILLRYFGLRVVSHLSCSPGCPGTSKIADDRITLMFKDYREETEWMLDYLSKPMEWISYHGVVEIDTPDFLGLTHTYPYMEEPRKIKWNKEVK